MRITNQMISRNYLNRMNTNLGNLTRSNERMSSQRSFNKGYENVPDAGKALRLRQLISDNERRLTTIRDASGRAVAAEDNVRAVNDLMIRSKDRLVQALNGTVAPEDREKIATELDKMKGEILQIMNGQFSNQFLFHASGNAEGKAPFVVDDAGQLTYNGTSVNDMVKSPKGQPTIFDEATNSFIDIPWNTPNYVDIGAGYNMDATGTNVDPNTAYKDTYSGVDCFGYGVSDKTGMPLNAYSLFSRMVDGLRADNLDIVGDALDTIPETMDFMLTAVTDIGARGSMLESTGDRLDIDLINMYDDQNRLEGIDLSREIINNKNHEMSWMVTLQLGSKILPQTIFDFIR